jgi:hypothetical protein
MSLIVEELYKHLAVPHVFNRKLGRPLCIGVPRLYGIVTQMNRFVTTSQSEWTRTKPEMHLASHFTKIWYFLLDCCNAPQVGVTVHPNIKGVPGGHEEPLSNVKFGVVDQKWTFNILLDNVTRLMTGTFVHHGQNVLQSHVQGDPPTPGGGTRFDNPDIHESVHDGFGPQFQDVIQSFTTLSV